MNSKCFEVGLGVASLVSLMESRCTIGTRPIQDGNSQSCIDQSTKTVKRNEEQLVTMNKEDLLELLGAMEGELQAKEIALATLEAERVKQYIFQARYGSFLATDAIHALQRDVVQCPAKINSGDEPIKMSRSLDVLKQLLQTCSEGQICSRSQLKAIADEHQKVSLAMDQMKASICDYNEIVISERRMRQNNMELLLELNDVKKRLEMLEEECTALLELLKSEQETNRNQRLATSVLVHDRKKCAFKISKLVTLIHELENSLQFEQINSGRLSVKLAEVELRLEKERSQFQKELALQQRTLDFRNEELMNIRAELNEFRNSMQSFRAIENAKNLSYCDEENGELGILKSDFQENIVNDGLSLPATCSTSNSFVNQQQINLNSFEWHSSDKQDLEPDTHESELSQLECSRSDKIVAANGMFLLPPSEDEPFLESHDDIIDISSEKLNLEDAIKTQDRERIVPMKQTDDDLIHGATAEAEKLDAYLLSLSDHSEESKECCVTIDQVQEGITRHRDGMPIKKMVIGTVYVGRKMSWCELEKKLASTFLRHISEVSSGLKTKKVSRVEAELQDSGSFTLGVTLSSVKYYSIERYHWSPGKSSDKTPLELLSGFSTNVITIQLCDVDCGCLDKIAYDTLVPAVLLQNYLRLMEQYRCVIFYGPKGTGKTSLVQKLAECIQIKEKQNDYGCDITFHHLTESFTRSDLIRLLINKGCLLPSTMHSVPRVAPIIILDDLSRISVVDVFKDILSVLEVRGPSNQISVKSEGSQQLASYFMHPRCYIFGSMDRARSTGLELSIQQRFKWVQLRCDQEPMKNLLHRHMFRQLTHCFAGSIPIPSTSLYRVVEWVVCVWQRLNDGLAKLGMLDIIFGPCLFLSCPVESGKPKLVMRWLSSLWNTVIAPTISAAVISSSAGFSSSGAADLCGQKKIASTALYVLMQRAVVSGCPLSAQEKSRYFATFQGSNDLDIKIKGDKNDQRTSTPQFGPKLYASAATRDVMETENRSLTEGRQLEMSNIIAQLNLTKSYAANTITNNRENAFTERISGDLLAHSLSTVSVSPVTSKRDEAAHSLSSASPVKPARSSTHDKMSEPSQMNVIVTQPVNAVSHVWESILSHSDNCLELNALGDKTDQ